MTSALAEEPVHTVVPVPARLHLGFLDGLRALAALYVLLHHTMLTIWPYDRPTGAMLLLTEWLRYGHYAVCLFIVISGFCLMLPIVRGDGTLPGGIRLFFRRRARRILPPYYIVLAGSLLLATTVISRKTGASWDEAIPVTAGGALSHLLLIHNTYSAWKPQVNGVLWSVAVECQLYLLFPALVKQWAKRGGLLVTALALGVSFAGFLVLWHTSHAGVMPQFLGLFALGMFGAAVCFSPDRAFVFLRERMPWGALAAGSCSLLAFCCYKWGRLHSGGIMDYLAGMASVALIIAAAQPQHKTLRQFLSCKPLVLVGAFSYSLYLIHTPLLQIVWQYGLLPLRLARSTTFTLLTLVGTPLIIGVSYFFYLACERPFINSHLRRTTKMRA